MILNMDSIKTRGVIYTLLQLSNDQKRKGVVTILTDDFGSLSVIIATNLVYQ